MFVFLLIFQVLPTTSDKVDRAKALERCSCRKINKNKKKKPIKPVNEGEFISEVNYAKILSACLLILVLLLTVGIIVAFCVLNADSLNLCKTRARKRREREAALMSELAEKAAKEAAAAAAEAERQPMAWHPIYGRYGMVPPTMGGAFGMFAPRTMDIPANQAVV